MILSTIVAAPFLAAVLLLLVPERARLLIRLISLVGAMVSLVGSVLVAYRYDLEAGGLQMEENYPLVPSVGINLRLAVDGWGVSLLLLTGIIIATGVLASWTLKVVVYIFDELRLVV